MDEWYRANLSVQPVVSSFSGSGSLKEVRLGLFFQSFVKEDNRKMYVEEKPLGSYVCKNT